MTIAGSAQQLELGRSRLEVYGLTVTLPAFFKNRIGVNLLRVFILPGWPDVTQDYVSWAINMCFGHSGYRYETNEGNPSFTTDEGGNFNLRKWLSLVGTNATCNCYDQAGLVQIALGLAPNGGTTWTYMEPFGYIIQRDLIGIGQCNNPFFNRPGAAEGSICDNNDTHRTGFTTHVVVKVESKGIVSQMHVFVLTWPPRTFRITSAPRSRSLEVVQTRQRCTQERTPDQAWQLTPKI